MRGGNAALSVSISTLSTVGAMFLTPLNVTFWGSLDPAMNALLRSFSLDPLHMLFEVSLLLGLPLAAGMFIAHRYPALAQRCTARCATSRCWCWSASSSARWC